MKIRDSIECYLEFFIAIAIIDYMAKFA